MAEKKRNKMHSVLLAFKAANKDRIGMVSGHWLMRAVQGLAPLDAKAPWWVVLDKSHLQQLIQSFRESLNTDKDAIEKLQKILTEMEKLL